MEGSLIVQEVKKRKGNEGYNVATGEYEDLVKAGVVDPKKVTRSALQNAASIAGLLLTTEASSPKSRRRKRVAACLPAVGRHGWHGRHGLLRVCAADTLENFRAKPGNHSPTNLTLNHSRVSKEARLFCFESFAGHPAIKPSPGAIALSLAQIHFLVCPRWLSSSEESLDHIKSDWTGESRWQKRRPSVIDFLRRSCLFSLCLQRSYFAQATQMSRRLTELGREKRLHEIPGDGWSDSPATHTKHIHVIVLDTLACRKMVVD